MQNACGVRELKTPIQIFPLKQFQQGFLNQKKVEKLNFASVVMKTKLVQLIKKVFSKKDWIKNLNF